MNKRFRELVASSAGAIFIIVYFSLVLLQLAAINAGLEEWWGVHWLFRGVLALICANIPILGTILGIYGAIEAWHFKTFNAVLLFLSPLLFTLSLAVLGGATELFRKKFFKRGLSDIDIPPPFPQQTSNQYNPGHDQGKPIDGFLYIVAFAVFFGPLITIFSFFKNYLPLLNQSSMSTVLTGAAHNQGSNYLFTLGFDLLNIIVIFALQVLLIKTFLEKSKNFPFYFVIYRIHIFVFTILTVFLLSSAPFKDSISSKELFHDLFKTGLWSFIFICYLLMSKRVKETFVSEKSWLPRKKFVSSITVASVVAVTMFSFAVSSPSSSQYALTPNTIAIASTDKESIAVATKADNILELPPEEGSSGCNLERIGGTSREQFDNFDSALRKAAKNNNLLELLSFINLPVRWNVNKRRHVIQTQEELIKQAAKIFNNKTKDIIVHQKGFFCNDFGIAYGPGTLWINLVEDNSGHERFAITTINSGVIEQDETPSSINPEVIYDCKTEKNWLVIDVIENDVIRYRSWAGSNGKRGMPDLELQNPKVRWHGSGICSYRELKFQRGSYSYIVTDLGGCGTGEEKYPSFSVATLEVRKSEKRLAEWFCRTKNY